MKTHTAIIVLLVLIMTFLSSCAPSEGIRTNAQNLAIIDAGHSVSQNDAQTTKIQSLLDNIQAKTPNSETEITDVTAKARDILENKYGIKMTNYALLNEMSYTIPQNNQYDYAEIMAQYIVMRSQE